MYSGYWDHAHGTVKEVCDYQGTDLEEGYGCDCTGCSCQPQPSPAPSVSPRPSATMTPSASPPCDVGLGGSNDGYYTSRLGNYAFEGYDASGAPFFKREDTGDYVHLYSGDWHVGSGMSGNGDWKGANPSSNSPLDVATWKVWDGSTYISQPGVAAICATPPPSPNPTSSPAPTQTFEPTDPQTFVANAVGLRMAVESATSDANIVLTEDVVLAATLVFPQGRTGLALRGGGPENRTTIAGDGTFMLIDVWGTELALEDLVLTGGYTEADLSAGAISVYQGALWARRCTFSHNRGLNTGGAVLIDQSTATFEDSLFELNEVVEGSGGAMFVRYDSRATILRTTYKNNKAQVSGGGVMFAGNRPSVAGPSIMEDCLVMFNNASSTGGGISVTATSTTVHFSTTQFLHNYAGQSGGALSGWDDAIITVADSVMSKNAAGDAGGSAFVSATSLTFDNVSVADSVAGRAGGGVAIAGDTSTGTFRSVAFGRCNASAIGGAIAASSDVAELIIEGGAFAQCAVGEQGGAVHVDGTGVLRVANTSFEDVAVGYSVEPVCLTLTMIMTSGGGWNDAELFVFRKEDYKGRLAVYDCPRTCVYDPAHGYEQSCDDVDGYWGGTDPAICDVNGVDLATNYGCSCSGCVCAGYEPPSHTYLHRFTLADGFSATEEVCFEREHGRGEYVILATEDRYYSEVQWTLEGHVVDGEANDLRHLDFTTLESKEGCETPGEE